MALVAIVTAARRARMGADYQIGPALTTPGRAIG